MEGPIAKIKARSHQIEQAYRLVYEWCTEIFRKRCNWICWHSKIHWSIWGITLLCDIDTHVEDIKQREINNKLHNEAKLFQLLIENHYRWGELRAYQRYDN